MSHQSVGLIAAGLAGLALGVAEAAEHLGGLVPCALCLWERWPYRAVVAAGLVAAVLPARPARYALLLALLAALLGGVLGIVHVGVEQAWWPSPLPECLAPVLTGRTIAERLAQMPLFPAKPCDEPSFLWSWLPMSLAQMSLLCALAFSAFLAISLWEGERRPR
jgi:disulfide bond formation protein DsbB